MTIPIAASPPTTPAPRPTGGRLPGKEQLRLAFGEVHARLCDVNEGEIASYIPALASADSAWFGLSATAVDGWQVHCGDAARPFTLQSASKPFVYALALAEFGWDGLRTRVGLEQFPGRFDAVGIEAETGRARNPMINAGAIVVSSMVAARGGGPERLLAGLAEFAGRELSVDRDVLASETATADVNRALGYLLRRAGILDGDVEDALAAYFTQCSVLVTASDLAVMGATLANGGVNPLNGRTVVGPLVAGHVLAEMTVCGLYGYSGEWFCRAGLPAKSGVSGGLCASVPGLLGIGAYSPPLDPHGNSVRATAAIEELSARMGLHLMVRR